MANNNNGDNSDFEPDGMRVLAVDDNLVCLTILKALLKKCRYEVTSFKSKKDALSLLKSNVDNFDIVLTNVNMDEMDGFKLLEAGLELDIPVIMISANECNNIIRKGVEHGAVDYIIKPVRLEAVKTIWQHVFRKKLPSKEEIIRTQLIGSGPGDGLVKRVSKRKSSFGDDEDDDDDYSNDLDDKFDNNRSDSKRERIKWTRERHEKFLKAVEILGGDEKAVPKKILELMNESSLTREKVASHLQKFRKAIKKKAKHEQNSKLNDIINNNTNRNHRFLGSSAIASGNALGYVPGQYLGYNNRSWIGGPSALGYNRYTQGPGPGPLLLDGPNSNQLILQPHPRMIMPTITDPVLNNPVFGQIQLENPFGSNLMQPQEEMFDAYPMIDSVCEPTMNARFDMTSDYSGFLDSLGDGKNDQLFRTS